MHLGDKSSHLRVSERPVLLFGMPKSPAPATWHLTEAEQLVLLKVALDTRPPTPALQEALREAAVSFRTLAMIDEAMTHVDAGIAGKPVDAEALITLLGEPASSGDTVTEA
ncbi:MAG: hypothetical protein ABI831_24930 [Betaproteobacteria bacterium]